MHPLPAMATGRASLPNPSSPRSPGRLEKKQRADAARTVRRVCPTHPRALSSPSTSPTHVRPGTAPVCSVAVLTELASEPRPPHEGGPWCCHVQTGHQALSESEGVTWGACGA